MACMQRERLQFTVLFSKSDEKFILECHYFFPNEGSIFLSVLSNLVCSFYRRLLFERDVKVISSKYTHVLWGEWKRGPFTIHAGDATHFTSFDQGMMLLMVTEAITEA